MTMFFEYTLSAQREDFYNITSQLSDAVTKSGLTSGHAIVFCPHTTAGITINENADPDVVGDMLLGLREAYPDRSQFRHGEGNSAAHLKASAIGSSVTVIIENGKPLLGTWQGVYFCEFDPPRQRKFYIKVEGEKYETRGLNEKCKLCGFDNCTTCDKAGATCVFSNVDNPIACIARLAPSAMNFQPWKLEFAPGKVTVKYDGKGIGKLFAANLKNRCRHHSQICGACAGA